MNENKFRELREAAQMTAAAAEKALERTISAERVVDAARNFINGYVEGLSTAEMDGLVRALVFELQTYDMERPS